MSAAWPSAPVGDVLRHRKQFITIDDLTRYKRCRVQLHAQGIVLRDVVPGSEINTKSQQVCRAGEFLVAEIDAKMGGFGIVPADLDGAIVSSHYFLFEVIEDRLDRRFLGWYCKTPAFRDQVRAQGTTNYAAIRPAHVLAYTIPLPPLAEQRRIVARLDALAAKVEEAKRLQRETSDALEALEHGMVRGGFARCSNAILLPIEQVCEVRGGIQKRPSRTASANPVRYLTVAHVFRDRIKVDDPRYFEVSPSELERCRLQAGDVLIIEGNGSADQIGRAALFQGEIDPCVHQNHVIRVRPDQSRLRSAFLNAFLNSPVGQDEVQTRSRTTSGLRSLSVGRIREIQIPIPPLEQQDAILASVGEARSRVRRSHECVRDAGKRLAPLLPSILNRAFAGAL